MRVAADAAWNVRVGVVTIILKYSGEIPSEQQGNDKQIAAKQDIRRVFSSQLRKHWRQQAPLAQWLANGLPIATHAQNQPCSVEGNSPFFRVNICGFSAIPLVSYINRLSCELEMSFLGEGRSLVKRAGDLDNRVKVVFDALRIPHNNGEVPGSMFGKGQELFCLLEDDSLITKFCVEAQESLGSPVEHELTIKAKIEPVNFAHPLLETFR